MAELAKMLSFSLVGTVIFVLDYRVWELTYEAWTSYLVNPSLALASGFGFSIALAASCLVLWRLGK